MLSAVPPRVGAVAALGGGLAWGLKAAAILITGRDVILGVDLGTMFVAVQVFFGVTILGLHHLVRSTGVLLPGAEAPEDVLQRTERERADAREQGEPLGFEDPADRIRRRAAVGSWCGAVALVAGVVYIVSAAAGVEGVAGLSALVTSIAWIAGLIGIGLASGELRVLSEREGSLPFRMGLWVLPAGFVGWMLTLVHVRLVELPVLVYGVLFIVLARQLWRADPET